MDTAKETSRHSPPRFQLVTREDLFFVIKELKTELLQEVKLLVQGQPQPPPKKWLKTREVRKLLDLSPGTLQTLRDNGTIPYSKLGTNFFYDTDDINRELERRKSIGRNRSGQFIHPAVEEKKIKR